MRRDAREGQEAAGGTIGGSHCIALALMLKFTIAKTDGIPDLSNSANSDPRLAVSRQI